MHAKGTVFGLRKCVNKKESKQSIVNPLGFPFNSFSLSPSPFMYLPKEQSSLMLVM